MVGASPSSHTSWAAAGAGRQAPAGPPSPMARLLQPTCRVWVPVIVRLRARAGRRQQTGARKVRGPGLLRPQDGVQCTRSAMVMLARRGTGGVRRMLGSAAGALKGRSWGSWRLPPIHRRDPIAPRSPQQPPPRLKVAQPAPGTPWRREA